MSSSGRTLMNMLGKTRVHVCSDGREIVVFKNADNAFPFSVSNKKRKAALGVSHDQLTTLGLDAELVEDVEGILIKLDGKNQSLIAMFRAFYTVYQSDPCKHADYYAEQVAELVRSTQRLTEAEVLLTKLVELCRNGCTAAQAQQIVSEMARLLENPNAYRARTEIDDTRSVVSRMLEEQESMSPELDAGEE